MLLHIILYKSIHISYMSKHMSHLLSKESEFVNCFSSVRVPSLCSPLFNIQHRSGQPFPIMKHIFTFLTETPLMPSEQITSYKCCNLKQVYNICIQAKFKLFFPIELLKTLLKQSLNLTTALNVFGIHVNFQYFSYFISYVAFQNL